MNCKHCKAELEEGCKVCPECGKAVEIAEENAKACQDFLTSDTLTAKRILAAWSKANGQTEFVEKLLAQSAECLQRERMLNL